MKRENTSLLVCPSSKRPLELQVTEVGVGDRVLSGFLVEPISGKKYPIINYIPRFVDKENYANNFGFQWNEHLLTQMDEYSKVNISGDRFFKETKWGKALKGEIILEAGSGAGRFTKHATSTGAQVVSFDFSNAVDANYKLNGAIDNLLIVQANIFEMPFANGFFDKAFCFGVLQHTPDPKRAFMSILEHVKPGGKVAADVYLKSYKSYLHVKPYVRPFTKGMAPEKLYKWTKKYVDLWWPLAKRLRKSKLGQKLISRFIADRSDYLPNVSDSMLKEWAYLDTFDWFSPAFDQPKTRREFESWYREAGLNNIEVHYGFNGVEGRGVKSGSKNEG